MRRCGPCFAVCVTVHVKAVVSTCAYGWPTMYEWAARARDRARAPFTPSFPVDTCTCVYCMVKRGPTFPRTTSCCATPRSPHDPAAPFSPRGFFSSSKAAPTLFPCLLIPQLRSSTPLCSILCRCACPYLVSVFLSLFLSLSFFLSFSRSISRSSVSFSLCVSLSPTPFRSVATFRPELL